MYEPHHGPLPNSYFLMSIFGVMFGLVLFKVTPAWAFVILLFSVIMFVSSFYSASRAPLATTHDDELALHQKHTDAKYPATDLHHGMIKKGRYVGRHKKRLVKAHFFEVDQLSAAMKASVKKKPAKKRR